ncbi:MarR family transcriptional regulator [Lysinibacillus parviboronicapiens]|uniref:MarR family transcriptional regulator n=1 Tax=Lysinibacillus parviboronicapiens TaxID=436516 RepID=UPI000D3C6ED4|nr:MarR family transcriptional regulator [Lysinibacillus parviboronicapiens]
MKTIAVIGSLFFWDNIKEYFKEFPKVQFIHFPYTVPEESVGLIDEAASKSDILLFAGSIPYYYCYKKIQVQKIQATYIPVDELSLSLSLLSIIHSQKIELANISIDLPNKDSFYQVITEAGLQADHFFLKDYAWVYEQQREMKEFQIEEYIHFHKNLYAAGKTKHVLTCLHAVFVALNQLGIPSTYMVDSKHTFVSTISKAIDAYKYSLLSSSQIAVVSIASQEKSLVNNLLFLESIEKICKIFNARVSQSQSEPFVIYATRGAIRKSNIAYFQSLIGQLEKQFETFFNIGIGIGYSLHEAEIHSSQALFFTNKFKNQTSVLCLVDEDSRLLGSLFENERKISLLNNDKQVLALAEEIKMSAKNLKLMKQFIGMNNNRPFSAAELAEYMNLSRRSAERIISRLIDNNYLLFIGEEHPYNQGRPRKVYKATTHLISKIIEN